MSQVSHEWSLPHDTTAPAEGRRHARAALGSHPRIDDIELAVSELLTNAVVHGSAPVLLRLDATPERARVEVEDAGSGPHGAAPTGLPGHDDPHGRGLPLVGLVASAHGGSPSDLGWIAWAEFDS